MRAQTVRRWGWALVVVAAAAWAGVEAKRLRKAPVPLAPSQAASAVDASAVGQWSNPPAAPGSVALSGEVAPLLPQWGTWPEGGGVLALAPKGQASVLVRLGAMWPRVPHQARWVVWLGHAGKAQGWRTVATVAPSQGMRAWGVTGRYRGPALAYVLDGHGREAYMAVLATAQSLSAVVQDARALHRVAHSAPRLRSPYAFTLLALWPHGKPAPVRVGAGQGALVDFFATWCHACAQDLTALAAYEKAAHEKGLPPVVAVDLTVAEPSQAYVARFVHRHRLTFPVALDTTGQVASRYGVAQIPAMALVTKDGKVVWRHVGALPAAQLLHQVRAHLVR